MKFSGKHFSFIIFVLLLFWCAGFSINVISNNSGTTKALIPLLNIFYDNVCHQQSGKNLLTGDNYFLVCSRCTGIYFGALFSSFIFLFHFRKIKISLKIFLSVCVILLADVVINNFVFISYNKISAFATGLLFGSVILLMIIEILPLPQAKNE